MILRLVLNPGSRSGRGQKLWRVWDALLQAAGCQVERCLTENLTHAVALARDSQGVDGVVAVGGDGTINAVLDGVLQSGRSDLSMGVLYSGTSPDFCRFHGIPLEPQAAVRALLSGRRRPVDVVRITFRNRDGAPVTAHFGCGSNIGLGAAVARRANRMRRFLGDGLGTGLAAVVALLRVPAGDLLVEADGRVHELPRCNNLSILKSPFIASGLKLDLGLQPDDGELCAVAVSGKRPAELLRLLPGFYTGRAVRDPSVRVWRCRRLVVRGPMATEVEFDGDPRGFLPATMEILPRSLLLMGGT
jgi:diacylglycerol kinase family enzyme